ncbi:helix-turn-helix transcriptional regulator [Streptomyces sp. SCA3-4]|uniref:helix-turn-helix domain-containing protein n=1 Tax=Streptomyces sichuanensis TaxID=2871810 RepID=UPI001CE25681|nr:helix-turn-helix transcriptional regulator [Streptomyces sichuanensis]MCA6094716.1 helix-turn-helix transcriptional regulator [Streptomyces sichuanensis]
MGEESQPPIGWRYCGDQLKLWRQRAGVSREKLAEEAGYGYETIKSMEQGRRRPSLRVLQVADQMCGAGGLLEAAHKYLQPERFVSYAQDFMRQEAEAIAVSSYQPLLIPGLLQTEETMQVLFTGHWPPRDGEETEALVAARLGRQVMLDKQTKVFNFVIGEVALREPLADRASHKRQLLHLGEQSARRNVALQVMPSGSGVHPGLDGSFVLLEMPDHDRLVYEEGQQSGVLYGDPDKVHVVAQRYVMIAQRALSPGESVRFIGKLAEEL